MKDKNEELPEDGDGGFDWDAIKQRLEINRADADRGWASTPAQQKKILRARARAIAGEVKVESDGEQINIVEFSLAHEKYGIESSLVSEVFQVRNLVSLPGTPDFVAGIINLRSRIISVIDIKKIFNLPEQGLTNLNQVIVIASEEMEFGILADAIVDVRSVFRSELQPSLATLTGIRAEYLLGITKQRVVILDGQRLLSDRSLVVDDR
jgi:purine-binding chemotaxis protein CheW